MNEAIEALLPTGQHSLRSDVMPANHLTADVRDAPRNRDLVRWRVVNRCTDGLLIGQTVIGPGTHEVLMYEDHADQVTRLVEPDRAAIEMARRSYWLQLLDEARDLAKDFQGDTDAFMKHVAEGRATERQMDAIRKCREETNLSVEGVFREMFKRDILPLDSAEIVKGAPKEKEPKKLLLDQDRRQYADGIAEALRQVLGPIAQGLQQNGGAGGKPRQ